MPIIVKNINKQNERPHSNRMRSLRFYRKNLYFYVLGELMLSDMLRSKYSYQRNTYTQSSILYKRKKGVSIDTNYKRKNGVSTNWHRYYIVHFFVCQRFFWNFLKNFFTEKDNLKFIRLPFLFFNACQYTLIVFDAFLYAIVLISTFQYNSYPVKIGDNGQWILSPNT